MSATWIRIGMGLGIALVLYAPAIAADKPDNSLADQIERERRSLEKLREEIEQNKRQAGEVEKRQASVLQSLQNLDDRLMVSRQQRYSVNRELKQKDRDLERISNHLDELRLGIRKRRSSIQARLRVQFMRGRLGYIKALLSAESVADLQRRFRYLSAISEREYELVAAYSEDLSRLEEVEAQRAQARDQMLTLKKKTDRKLRQIRGQKREKKTFLARITRQKELYDQAIEELQQSEARVDALLNELLEAQRKAALLKPRPGVPSMLMLKGALPWPADGKVVSFFGRQKHPSFDTYVERKGIDIRTGEGSGIRAVMEGTVVYADWLKGYGLVLILDHKNGFFSLYAHAAKLLTKVGAEVQAREIIGEAGDTGLTGQNTLYFELRDGAEPVDPLRWLAKRP